MEQISLSANDAAVNYILQHHRFRLSSLYSNRQIAIAMILPALSLFFLAYYLVGEIQERHLSANTILFLPAIFFYMRYIVQVWKSPKFCVIANCYDAAINKQLVTAYLESRNIAYEDLAANAVQINSRNVYSGQSAKEAVLFVFGDGRILLNRHWLQTGWIPLSRSGAQQKAYKELQEDISKLA